MGRGRRPLRDEQLVVVIGSVVHRVAAVRVEVDRSGAVFLPSREKMPGVKGGGVRREAVERGRALVGGEAPRGCVAFRLYAPARTPNVHFNLHAAATRARAASYSDTYRSTSAPVAPTVFTGLMPWPQPQMSFQAFDLRFRYTTRASGRSTRGRGAGTLKSPSQTGRSRASRRGRGPRFAPTPSSSCLRRSVAAPPPLPAIPGTERGHSADESRRRRGCRADIPRRRVAATPRR